MGPARALLNRVRDGLPLRPVEEKVDEFLNRRVLAEDQAIEEAEAARYLAAHGPVPFAEVVTITATYRRRTEVARAVESALAQTGVASHRVVVVDDGGGETDAIPDDPRVTVISLAANTHNAGLVRNVGLRVSDSAYVAFLDDDNVWLPHHLRSCLDVLEEGADLVYTGVTVLDGTGAVMEVWSKPWDRRSMAVVNHVDLNAICLRRQGPWARGEDGVLLSRLRRRPRSPRYEDWELAWRVGSSGRVAHVPEATVRYRRSVLSSFRSEDDLES